MSEAGSKELHKRIRFKRTCLDNETRLYSYIVAYPIKWSVFWHLQKLMIRATILCLTCFIQRNKTDKQQQDRGIQAQETLPFSDFLHGHIKIQLKTFWLM